MEIGNQIKALRSRRGITQETLAEKLGITAQAVSKWERGAAAPDIEMLPQISAFFGVSIDELFALSDDTRMERIQNMLWDVRCLDEADVRSSREFLLEKARREPENGRPWELLADLENHLAKARHHQAAQYAKEALSRSGGLGSAHQELVEAMGGKSWDWAYSNHNALIRYYQAHLRRNPGDWHAHMWLMDQLIDDYRFEEAQQVLASFQKINSSYRVPLYQGMLAWHMGDKEEAYGHFARMEAEFPGDWAVYQLIGDHLTRDGDYAKALRYYRKALETKQPPKYVDPLESMAHIYELLGEHEEAAGVLDEELELLARDWNTTEGETADAVRREIARLRSPMEGSP